MHPRTMTNLGAFVAAAPGQPPLRIETRSGAVRVATRTQIEQNPLWRRALDRSFAHARKDSRYYRIVEETLEHDFQYGYFLLEDAAGALRSVQPFFVLDQDMLSGLPRLSALCSRSIRLMLPRFLMIRTLMVGCAAGEGHLGTDDDPTAAWIAENLQEALLIYARHARAGMVVFKEFPAQYRQHLRCLARDGYTRVPSLPMTRLSIDYASFDDYLVKALSKSARKDLLRKFKKAGRGDPIEMSVVNDIAPHLDEVYPLYLQVFSRSSLQFEKLTPDYFRRIGQEMPDKARFFIWRQHGRAIAFNFCMLLGNELWDEYLGLDYAVALDLHLYFITLRDVIGWAIRNGSKWYCSGGQGFEPKLRLRCRLDPVDLYVRHRVALVNALLKRLLPLLEPTRGDKILAQFPNYHELWGTR
jgi:hypothetical protein